MANKPTYIMVPRKLIRTWVITTGVLFVMIVASFQYSNWVNDRSNRQLCGVISLFNETYDKSPPTTESGKLFQGEMFRIYKVFKCK